MFNVFKEGDLITGTDKNGYGITNSQVYMQVVSTRELSDTMNVRVLGSLPYNKESTDYPYSSEHYPVTNDDKLFKYFVIPDTDKTPLIIVEDLPEPIVFG